MGIVVLCLLFKVLHLIFLIMSNKLQTLFKLLTLFLLGLTTSHSKIWAQSIPSDLFISEYIEGSSNNKALEIYNGTGTPVDLAAGNYVIQMYFNGSTTPSNF